MSSLPTQKGKSNKGKPRPKPDHRSKNVTPTLPQGVKPTNEELERRVEEVEVLLARGARSSQIHAAICAKYKVHWMTVNRYVLRATKNLRKRFEKSKHQHTNDSFSFYESVILAGDASAGAKIRARQRIDELLGLDAPKQVHTQLSGPAGGKIEIEQKVKQEFDHDGYREAFRQVIGVPEPHGNGEPVHPARTDAEAGGVPGGNGK